MKRDWFDDKGNIRGDINIHDKDIPCFIRLGMLFDYEPACFMCIYAGSCKEDATEENQDAVRKAYPKMFDGTIQTREQYEKYVKGWL